MLELMFNQLMKMQKSFNIDLTPYKLQMLVQEHRLLKEYTRQNMQLI